MSQQRIKDQILEALAHPEAEEGLYFENLSALYEEEERPIVEGTEVEILDALKALVDEKRVRMDEEGERVIFYLIQ